MHCGACDMTLYIEPHTAVCFMLTEPVQGIRVGQACCCCPLWWAAVLCWLVTCGAMRNKLWFNCCWPITRSLSRITEVRRLITTSSTHSEEQGSDSFVAHFLSYCHIIFSVTRCPPIYILCILIYICIWYSRPLHSAYCMPHHAGMAYIWLAHVRFPGPWPCTQALVQNWGRTQRHAHSEGTAATPLAAIYILFLSNQWYHHWPASIPVDHAECSCWSACGQWPWPYSVMYVLHVASTARACSPACMNSSPFNSQ